MQKSGNAPPPFYIGTQVYMHKFWAISKVDMLISVIKMSVYVSITGFHLSVKEPKDPYNGHGKHRTFLWSYQ